MPFLEDDGLCQVRSSCQGPERDDEFRFKGHILFVDAYDSFSENIIAMLQQLLHVQVTTVKIDAFCPGRYLQAYDAIVVGPGPGNPKDPGDIGHVPELWTLKGPDLLPVLGICLGFQSLCLAFGGTISRLPLPCHGQVKHIEHSDTDIFEGVGDLEATNYHSLHITLDDSISDIRSRRDEHFTSSQPKKLSRLARMHEAEGNFSASLKELAWSDDGILMAVKHRTKPLWGLQFHPESCRSDAAACEILLHKWWRTCQRWNVMSGRQSHTRSRLKATDLGSERNVHAPEPDGHSGQRSRRVRKYSGRKMSSFRLEEADFPDQPARSIGYTSADNDLQCLLRELTRDCTPTVDFLPVKYSQDLSARLLELSDESPKGMTTILESTRGGRYSIFSAPSPRTWRLEYYCASNAATIAVAKNGSLAGVVQHFTDVGDIYKHICSLTTLRKVTSSPVSSPFYGGFVGFLSYEAGLEKFQKGESVDPVEHSRLPDLSFLWVDRSVIIDHETNTAWLQTVRRDDQMWLKTMARKLSQPSDLAIYRDLDQTLGNDLQRVEVLEPNQQEYKAQIRTCQEFLRSGDSYELCLTAETKVMFPPSDSRTRQNRALALYMRLRKSNPVPFASYLSLGDTKVVGASPEQFMTWSRDGEVNMIPMKGTVKKSPGMTFARASEILASPKEQGENLMIADLIRHDLHSLFSATNKVDVVKLCDVVEHETVYQLVSHIRTSIPYPLCATTNERLDLTIQHGQRALLSALPPGSMTGAPKKRSCKILSTLERRQRGLYSGAIGYLDLGGAGAFSVCIRTAFNNSGSGDEGEVWRIGAGGAITVLSDEEGEWLEMRAKLESVLNIFKPQA